MVEIVFDGTPRQILLGNNTGLAALKADEASASAAAAASSAGALQSQLVRFPYLPTFGQDWLAGFLDRYSNIAGGVLRSGALSFKTAIFNSVSVGSIAGQLARKVLSLAGVNIWTGGKDAWVWAPVIDRYGQVPGYIDTAGVWRIKTAVIDNLTSGALSTTPAISWYGDSLSDGFNGFTPPLTTLAAALSRTGNRFAIGGQSAPQIASRQGGRARRLTISGGQIASGANTVTHIDAQTIAFWEALSTGRKTGALFLSTPGNAVTYSLAGRLGPIRGTLTRTRPASAEVYTFTADAAFSGLLPYPMTADQPFIADTIATANDTLIIWVGRNDVPPTGAGATAFTNFIAAVKDEIAIMVQACLHKRFIVLGVTNASDEFASSKADCFNAIVTLNTDLAALYGNSFIDIRQQLIARGLGLQGVSPVAQDTTDIGNSVIPINLRSDTVHMNANGYAAVAKIVQERITAEGF